MHRKTILFLTLFWLLPSLGTPIGAEEKEQPQEEKSVGDDLARLRKELVKEKGKNEARIEALEEEIRRLTARIDSVAKPDKEGGAPEENLGALLGDIDDEEDLDTLLGGLTGGGGSNLSGGELSLPTSAGHAFQSMNPNISILGDFIGHYTTQEGEDLDDEFLFRELEMGFSAAIDPFARADFFVCFGQDTNGDWEMALEEGYVTFLALPWDIQPRVGRFRSTFGKANPMHAHALPWVEYPLAIQNYFGAGGLSGDGVGLNWLVPNPWDDFIELSYEITNNDNDGDLFAGNASNDFMQVVHLKDFLDLTDASTLEVGMSYATAPNDDGHTKNRTSLAAADLTWKWRPPEAGLYKSFLWQTEAMAANADFPVGGRERTWGMYSAFDYQFDRRWTVGARYDYSEMPIDDHLFEQAYSGFLTFIQSEFLYWRLGYRYTGRNFSGGFNDRHEQEVFLQMNFGIGPHRAHKY